MVEEKAKQAVPGLISIEWMNWWSSSKRAAHPLSSKSERGLDDAVHRVLHGFIRYRVTSRVVGTLYLIPV